MTPRNLLTVCAQTYQNYKSALKWWHIHHDPISKGKFGYEWPAIVDDQINQQINEYKTRSDATKGGEVGF